MGIPRNPYFIQEKYKLYQSSCGCAYLLHTFVKTQNYMLKMENFTVNKLYLNF